LSDNDPEKEKELRRMDIYTFYFRLLAQKERADKDQKISDTSPFGKKNWQ
jgi:hypothetical protein